MQNLKTAVRARRMRSLTLKLAILGIVALIVGFGAFVWFLPEEQSRSIETPTASWCSPAAHSRITDALELLASGRGKRLLITGVNPVPRPPISPIKPATMIAFLACCVDLDYSALNTLGNAVQVRIWATAHNFHSLIVVTSAYHMPRALAELAHQLPDDTLIPYPVVSDRLRVEPWWSNGDTTKLVLSEYLKFLFANMRMRFDSVTADDGRRRVADASSS